MPVPVIDETQWPLVTARWVGPISRSDLDEHFDQIRALLERRLVFAAVFDIQPLLSIPADLRGHAVGRMDELAPLTKRYLAGLAHVVRSPVVRGILVALYWIAPAPHPVHIATHRQEAIAWAKAQLRTKSLT